MATMSVPTINVRDAVLQALGDRERKPMDILGDLGQWYADSDIKQAVAELIHEGKIELTSQRLLKAPPSQPA
jgi:hypothetical protein